MSFVEASPDDTDWDEWIREEYLDNVKDRETFSDFVWALIRDREAAAAREKADPEGGGYGAYGWQNSTIEAYLRPP